MKQTLKDHDKLQKATFGLGQVSFIIFDDAIKVSWNQNVLSGTWLVTPVPPLYNHILANELTLSDKLAQTIFVSSYKKLNTFQIRGRQRRRWDLDELRTTMLKIPSR